ncbi:MAG: hypothetical protein ABFC81_05525, partial [Rectinema sp.]
IGMIATTRQSAETKFDFGRITFLMPIFHLCLQRGSDTPKIKKSIGLHFRGVNAKPRHLKALKALKAPLNLCCLYARVYTACMPLI